MEYNFKITYRDDKFINVIVPEQRIGEFLECLSNKSIYWMEEHDSGFWTDLDTARYVMINKVQNKQLPVVTKPKIADPKKQIKPKKASAKMKPKLKLVK